MSYGLASEPNDLVVMHLHSPHSAHIPMLQAFRTTGPISGFIRAKFKARTELDSVVVIILTDNINDHDEFEDQAGGFAPNCF